MIDEASEMMDDDFFPTVELQAVPLLLSTFCYW